MENANEKILFEICCKNNLKRQIKFKFFAYKTEVMIPHILFVAFGALMCFLKPDVVNYFLMVILILWAPLVFLVGAFRETIYAKDIPDEYLVYSDRIENSDYHGIKKMYFNDFKAAYETENYFYINIGKHEYCIIDKDKFIVGNPADMRNFLYENLGKKFKLHK